MSFFFTFNKDNRTDMVNAEPFGVMPRWCACMIEYLLLSMSVFILILMFVDIGWWGVISGCLAFGTGFLTAKWCVK